MKKLSVTAVILVLGLSLSSASYAQMGPLYAPAAMVPAGLNSGDTFHIIFATSTLIDGTDGSIATYNNHVNFAASSSPEKGTNDPSIVWNAMVATTLGAEQGFILFSALSPVYNLNGDKIADDRTDLFDGSWDNPIVYSEDGVDYSGVNNGVYTGLQDSGTADIGFTLGDVSVAGNNINNVLGPLGGGSAPNGNIYRIYAVSPLLTVAAVVPPAPTGVPSSPAVW